MADRYHKWYDYPRRKDEHGRWLCRWCGRPLSGRRSAWCSEDCERQVAIRCGTGVRSQVWRRDRGRCARCGRDAAALARRLRKLWLVSPVLYADEIRELGITVKEAKKSLWEAHHTRPVKEGGGGCGLEGYETLCLWCHKAESKKR